MKTNFREKIKAAMKGSQRELCMKLKINRTTFGKFLKGEKSSTIEPVERIFDELKLSIYSEAELKAIVEEKVEEKIKDMLKKEKPAV